MVKHSDHSPDVRGKDTDRLHSAGARFVVFSGTESFVRFRGDAWALARTLPVDVILVEGYSRRRFHGARVRVRRPDEVRALARAVVAEVEWHRATTSPHASRPAPVTRAVFLVGRSTRLPRKFYRTVAGRTVLARGISAARRAGLSPEVVSVDPAPGLRVPQVRDRRGSGPLSGYAAAAASSPRPFFLFGGDMPSLDAASLRRMRAAFDGRSIVPIDARGVPQVLHAIYARASRGTVTPLLRRRAGLQALVDRLDARGEVRWWPARAVVPESFTDVDTPRDLRQLRRALAGRRRANLR